MVEPTLQLGLELGQPRVREAPLPIDEERRVHARLAAARLLEAGGIGVPGGRGIEHGAAADRRPATQDDPVASRRDDRRREPELREGTRPGDPRRHGGGAVVDVEPRAVGDRLELLERYVEPVARPQAAGCDESVAAVQLVALDARERERHPLSRLGPLDGAVVHLDASHTDVAARTARRGARRPRRPSPTRASRSRPFRSRAARRRGRRRGGRPRRPRACVSETQARPRARARRGARRVRRRSSR